MTATAFVLHDLVTGRRLGGCVIAPAARYCSIITAAGIARQFVPAALWPQIERELPQLDAGPVDADSATSTAALGERRTHSLVLQKLTEHPISDEQPETVVTQLDQVLRSYFLPPTLRLTQE